MIRSSIFSAGLLLCVFFLTGCTHTQHVQEQTTANITFDELHQALEGRRVDIKLNDTRTISSTALRIRSDTTWAIDMSSGRVRSASTNQIHSISWKRPGRGALEGALLGGAAGVVLGLAAGLALTSVRDSDQARTGVAQYVGAITGVGVILGVGSGTLIGARRGSHDRYVYPQLYQAERENATDAAGAGSSTQRR